MKLGLVTYNLAPKWDLATIIKNCRAAGFEGVEFRTTHAHGVEPSLSAEQRREVKQRCADGGLTIWGLGTACEFHSPDAEVVRRQVAACGEFVKLAADIGARGVKVRPNALPKEVPVHKTLEQIGKSLAACGKVAGDLGVEVWLDVSAPGVGIQSAYGTDQLVVGDGTSQAAALASGVLAYGLSRGVPAGPPAAAWLQQTAMPLSQPPNRVGAGMVQTQAK